jgi:uncharacterized protein
MIPLTAAERRVLGCLAEKQLATPQHYPLTESALISACNQTTNRDPLVAYDQSDVRPALIGLRDHGLVKRVRREGERAEKHAHRLDETLGLAPAPLAVLTVLLLRGAQTPGELRSRTARLHPFPDQTALNEAVADLAERGLVEQLPRRPGEKQARWRHLLVDEDGETAEQPAREAGSDDPEPDVERLPTLRALVEEVARLRERVATLERELGLVEPDRRAVGK